MVDPIWGVDVLRLRLQAAEIRQADTERRYEQLATFCGRLERSNRRLYELLPVDIKAAMIFAEAEMREEQRTERDRILKTLGIG